MNILVTGGNGYLGARISQHLTNQKHLVSILCRTELKDESWKKKFHNVIVGNISHPETIEKIGAENFDVIIHLVSLDHNKSNNKPSFVTSVNVLPTWELLNAFTTKGLKKFIYFSTQQVYGKLPNIIVDEDRIPKPLNNYGLTHLLSENIVDYFHRSTDTQCINLRLSNGYGSPVFTENNCWWLVVNDLCKTAFTEKKIQMLSDGSPLRDFIHVEDITRFVELLINTEKPDFNLFNVSSGKTLTILDLAHQVQSIFKERYTEHVPVILPTGELSKDASKFSDIKRYTVDNSRMSQLGFKQSQSLQDGINELFTYLENTTQKSSRTSH